MHKDVPQNLIFENSSLNIVFEQNTQVNRTQSAIILSGTRSAFLSLANIILFFANDLEEEIELHKIWFVKTSIQFTILIDDKVRSSVGDIDRDNNQYTWKLKDSDIDHIASRMHSLGHINCELHLDYGKDKNDISVYCVVSETVNCDKGDVRK